MNQLNIGTILASLRDATADDHAKLDASFGSLRLDDRDDYVRFLRAHAAGLEPLFATYRRFVETELDHDCPDFQAMLAEDLHALGLSADADLAVTPPPALDGIGIAYVVTGSRLGLTLLRRQGYWGAAHGQPSRYMEDERGLALWKDLLLWLRGRRSDAAEIEAAVDAARAAFACFRRAFVATAPIGVN